MLIHFVCRGNVFRSVMAEAYTNSLGLDGIEVVSSGTVAELYKPINRDNFERTLTLLGRHGLRQFAKDNYGEQLGQEALNGSDLVVCMNQIVYDECQQGYDLPENVVVWQVADLGEPGRVPKSAQERDLFSEDVYQEVVTNVDSLLRSGLIS